MATAPLSPDKPLVASGPSKDVDNTGWIVSLMQAQKELLMAIIEGNDVRYGQRFDASKEAIAAALNAAKEAVQKAEAAAEKRFEGVNEFRSTLSDQQRTLMPRQEAEALIRNLSEKIETQERRITENVSQREGIGQGWQLALGAVGLIGALLSIVAVSIVLVRTLT